MSQFPLLSGVGALPVAHDAQAAERGLERLSRASEASEDEPASVFVERLLADPQARTLLTGVFGNSPFLGQCLLRDIPFVAELFSTSSDRALAGVLEGLEKDCVGTTDHLMRTLRIARRRVALATAIADIAGLWPLEEVTAALSAFAEAALRQTLAHLFRAAAEKGTMRVDDRDPALECGLFVLGMGKLGAYELNYSSDIDLVVLYEAATAAYSGSATEQDFFAKLTRDLVRILQERTPEGYVFRCDLRLRPDAGATPLALSTAAAEGYYETVGQNWERAALIKARPVAGDIAAGEAFLGRIAPFIWRKHLDFEAIEDIHSIKRQIAAHRGHGRIAVEGHDLKLGRGGIREIEFFAQTQQLIAGGREPALRLAATCDVLTALAEGGRIAAPVAEELRAAYRFLRQVEHRLQMINDARTHTLPLDAADFLGIARFMGYRDSAAFATDVAAELRRVEEHYAALFERAPELGGPGSLVFTGTEDHPDTLETLGSLGFHEAHSVAETVRRWHHGRYRATRSARARELLTALVPALLAALGATAAPDAALARFDRFLAGLPTGVQPFSLFRANPHLLDLVAEIMGSAPRLAEHLSQKPGLFDAVLEPDFFAHLPVAKALTVELEERLRAAPDFEGVLDATRRWAHERQFQAGVQVLQRLCTPAAAGRALSNIAEVILAALLPRVEADFARRHGRVPGAALCVIAMGKLGARELTEASDLDLVFVYDNPSDAATSESKRPLATSQYFARLSQRHINALSASTAEGRLYEIDLRLRPAGNAGPVASPIEAFAAYERDSAWTWEHMALCRARVVAGPPAAAAKIDALRRAVLTAPRDGAELTHEVVEMRKRITAEHGSDDPWNVKYVRGGLVDLEFVRQTLTLRFAAAHPDILDPQTDAAFQQMAEAGVISKSAADELREAGARMRGVQAVLRLCVAGEFDPDAAPEGLRRLLAASAGAKDFADLQRDLERVQRDVRGHFEARSAPHPGERADPSAGVVANRRSNRYSTKQTR